MQPKEKYLDDDDKIKIQKEFLFAISNEVNLFYETPVVFLTKKDFSDTIFNTMCNIRKLLQGTTKEDKTAMVNSIVDFHLEWLHAVAEIENYMKLIPTLSRDNVFSAVSYTIDAMASRLKYYQRFVEKNRSILNNLEQANMTADIEITEELHKEVTLVLLDKLKCYRMCTDDYEFTLKIRNAAEELLLWIDKINDRLSMMLAKFINPNVPLLSKDLTKTLQQIVDELQTSKSQIGKDLIEDLKQRGQQLSTMIRCTTDRNLEISKVMEKINILDDRIKRIENEPASAALMALQHKKIYLERKLGSLENLRTTLSKLKEATIRNFDTDTTEDVCSCEDFYHMRIFNHSLPPEERERLVTELCYLWDLAIFGEKTDRSVISILSAGDLKEEFRDDVGTFSFDEYGRKIYKVTGDSTIYQLNDLHELVPLADDADHVYFYDECGRYFIDSKTRERIYKAHATASEYMMDSAGVLLKAKEVRDGVTYFYDIFGRYYINEDGRHIYRQEDATSEYENDGLGNLVRIRSRADLFDLCPADLNVTEDFQYLKQAVGQALRECIADCVMQQPGDPIKFLSARLLKYRKNFELRESMAREKEAMEIEKEFVREQERTAVEKEAMEILQGGSEATFDSNAENYANFIVDALDSSPSPSRSHDVAPSTKSN